MIQHCLQKCIQKLARHTLLKTYKLKKVHFKPNKWSLEKRWEIPIFVEKNNIILRKRGAPSIKRPSGNIQLNLSNFVQLYCAPTLQKLRKKVESVALRYADYIEVFVAKAHLTLQTHTMGRRSILQTERWGSLPLIRCSLSLEISEWLQGGSVKDWCGSQERQQDLMG